MPSQITLNFHCKTCLAELPIGKSPQEWARLDVGFTDAGYLQVWCTRHDTPICTINDLDKMREVTFGMGCSHADCAH